MTLEQLGSIGRSTALEYVQRWRDEEAGAPHPRLLPKHRPAGLLGRDPTDEELEVFLAAYIAEVERLLRVP